MCGIVACVGREDSLEIILDGLKKLEYRGYDSAGVAIFSDDKVKVVKTRGKIANLRKKVAEQPLSGNCGIGHTRWATHGSPSTLNAHPHQYEQVTIVHNGIIENYAKIKANLEEQGNKFVSETDSEILAHLVQANLLQGKTPVQSLQNSLALLEGTWAVALLIEEQPHKIWCALNQSPLVLGKGRNGTYASSDLTAVLPYTREMIFPEDGDICELSSDSIKIIDKDGNQAERAPQIIDWNPVVAEKAGFKHFMLKEIHEQPRSVTDTFRGKIDRENFTVKLPELDLDFSSIGNIYLVACGTSYYAALIGKFLIERLARIPVYTDIGSEFRYRQPLIKQGDLLVSISQSGETADTLAAVKEAQKRGAKAVSISNVLNSQIPRISQFQLYTHAGPEIGVASTKAFTAQITALLLFALKLAQNRGTLQRKFREELIQEILALPSLMHQVVSHASHLNVIARRYGNARDFLYIGRGINYPIALEGALKMKEISYIHAEGYPAGEMKHGPIALIEDGLPTVVIATKNDLYEKIVSNLVEVKSRGGQIIAIASQGDDQIGEIANDLFLLPPTHYLLEPLLTVLPMQLLAYYMAVHKGTDVDQPRNLAKSVTVE
ncbi:MAG: glutamine--fructose-6-phosphate transaminase (isomerizing) [Deltaproteobacteria bacterium]|jgi:glucosamine--fructose-6-phosphate aminotransferase (isomerizing)|nr:glutamine--fructose-6-phosphate transaminase (isomerizing) [Deltaproteobacteria bacterium]